MQRPRVVERPKGYSTMGVVRDLVPDKSVETTLKSEYFAKVSKFDNGKITLIV
ncbi:MAG: hypothetical protein OK457_07610 [Thaumarchaeota archaeon]|nr:hypothetical protein [Nitrososphaerota archaeon]